MPQDKRTQGTDPLDTLTTGTIEITGRMPYSSNATFLVKLTFNGFETRAIYKPHRGERPLWDFPSGLYMREAAAYALSEALGWDLVPPTVLRMDAPLGEGSVQLFVDADFSEHYFSLFERKELHPQLAKFAAFDAIANNADRKSGHILIDESGHLWGIDQGLCFHSDPKLRTVIWEFGGQTIPSEMLEDLRSAYDDCSVALEPFLSPIEMDAFNARLDNLLRKKLFPRPDPELRCYPWPLI